MMLGAIQLGNEDVEVFGRQMGCVLLSMFLDVVNSFYKMELETLYSIFWTSVTININHIKTPNSAHLECALQLLSCTPIG